MESDRSDYDVHKNVNLCTLTLNVDNFMYKLRLAQILCHVMPLLDFHNSFSESDNKTTQTVLNKQRHQ